MNMLNMHIDFTEFMPPFASGATARQRAGFFALAMELAEAKYDTVSVAESVVTHFAREATGITPEMLGSSPDHEIKLYQIAVALFWGTPSLIQIALAHSRTGEAIDLLLEAERTASRIRDVLAGKMDEVAA